MTYNTEKTKKKRSAVHKAYSKSNQKHMVYYNFSSLGIMRMVGHFSPSPSKLSTDNACPSEYSL